MAGSLNSDSIIWVIGEATGNNQNGVPAQVSTATLSGAQAELIADILDAVTLISDADVDGLRDELVASGYLPT